MPHRFSILPDQRAIIRSESTVECFEFPIGCQGLTVRRHQFLSDAIEPLPNAMEALSDAAKTQWNAVGTLSDAVNAQKNAKFALSDVVPVSFAATITLSPEIVKIYG